MKKIFGKMKNVLTRKDELYSELKNKLKDLRGTLVSGLKNARGDKIRENAVLSSAHKSLENIILAKKQLSPVNQKKMQDKIDDFKKCFESYGFGQVEMVCFAGSWRQSEELNRDRDDDNSLENRFQKLNTRSESYSIDMERGIDYDTRQHTRKVTLAASLEPVYLNETSKKNQNKNTNTPRVHSYTDSRTSYQRASEKMINTDSSVTQFDQACQTSFCEGQNKSPQRRTNLPVDKEHLNADAERRMKNSSSKKEVQNEESSSYSMLKNSRQMRGDTSYQSASEKIAQSVLPTSQNKNVKRIPTETQTNNEMKNSRSYPKAYTFDKTQDTRNVGSVGTKFQSDQNMDTSYQRANEMIAQSVLSTSQNENVKRIPTEIQTNNDMKNSRSYPNAYSFNKTQDTRNLGNVEPKFQSDQNMETVESNKLITEKNERQHAFPRERRLIQDEREKVKYFNQSEYNGRSYLQSHEEKMDLQDTKLEREERNKETERHVKADSEYVSGEEFIEKFHHFQEDLTGKMAVLEYYKRRFGQQQKRIEQTIYQDNSSNCNTRLSRSALEPRGSENEVHSHPYPLYIEDLTREMTMLEHYKQHVDQQQKRIDETIYKVNYNTRLSGSTVEPRGSENEVQSPPFSTDDKRISSNIHPAHAYEKNYLQDSASPDFEKATVGYQRYQHRKSPETVNVSSYQQYNTRSPEVTQTSFINEHVNMGRQITPPPSTRKYYHDEQEYEDQRPHYEMARHTHSSSGQRYQTSPGKAHSSYNQDYHYKDQHTNQRQHRMQGSYYQQQHERRGFESHHSSREMNFHEGAEMMRRQQVEMAKEVVEEEPLEIVDVHQYFTGDYDLKTLDDSVDTNTQIDTVHKWAQTFEDKVNTFSGEKFSLEYFVLDEKLMRLIEHLDKLKCHDDQTTTTRKIEVIQYIKRLHSILDSNAKDE